MPPTSKYLRNCSSNSIDRAFAAWLETETTMAAIIDAADPGHMTCEHTGLDLDLGQFSRLREPAATGGNVWG